MMDLASLARVFKHYSHLIAAFIYLAGYVGGKNEYYQMKHYKYKSTWRMCGRQPGII